MALTASAVEYLAEPVGGTVLMTSIGQMAPPQTAAATRQSRTSGKPAAAAGDQRPDVGRAPPLGLAATLAYGVTLLTFATAR